MFFVSTRNPKILCKFNDLLLQCIPNDNKGLFVPSFFTKMDNEQIFDLSNKTYKEILIELIYNFCDRQITKPTLQTLIDGAYQNFNKNFCPLLKNLNFKTDNYCSIQTFADNVEVMNLTHGPTGCIKDYSYCLTAELVNHFAKQKNIKMSVIDFSNGSSCASTAWAIKNKDYLKCFLFINKNKNTSAKALIAQAINNTNNIQCATADCDINFINKMISEIRYNKSLTEILNVTFINDLNLLNIIAYLPPFFKLYARCNMKPFCVSMPASNMTLATAALFAKYLGVPIKKIILATEKNDFLYDIQNIKVAKKQYNLEEGCSNLFSNVPSNIERILFYLYDNNQSSVNRYLEELDTNGRYKLIDIIAMKFSELFFVAKCDNQFNIRNTIYSAIREKDLYIEQHFAIAKIAIDIAQREIPNEINNTPIVIFNTMDFRRNVPFVNSALGYDLENISLPWSKEDIMRFSPQEIINDSSVILKYIIDTLEK